jgi:hypothetical protein
MWVTIPKDDDQDLRVTEAKEHERRRRLREMLYVPIRNYGVSKICVVESMLMLTKKIDVQKSLKLLVLRDPKRNLGR